jgi:hypothetical protein
LLIAAGTQPNAKAGMIVQDCQGMTPTSVAQRKVTFEVHLPEIVGPFRFEPLPGTVLATLFRIKPTMTA